jgi:hypothetical protein
MPFDLSGNFSRLYNWADDRNSGIKILASRMDNECDNFANALNGMFFRNGFVPMTGDIAMGQNYITGLGSGSLAAISVRFSDDPNSGLYLDGTGRPSIGVGGAKAAEFNAYGFESKYGRFISGGPPIAGEGTEIGYDGTGFVQAYNRNTASYKTMRVNGLNVALQAFGTTILSAGSTGVDIIGDCVVTEDIASSGGAVTAGTNSAVAQLRANGDIHASRAGGATNTGVIFLSLDDSKFLYNDSTKYILNAQGLEVGGDVTGTAFSVAADPSMKFYRPTATLADLAFSNGNMLRYDITNSRFNLLIGGLSKLEVNVGGLIGSGSISTGGSVFSAGNQNAGMRVIGSAGIVDVSQVAAIEIYYAGGIGVIQSYDRAGGLYKPFYLQGSTLSFGIGGVIFYTIDANGVLRDLNGNELGYRDVPQNAQAAAYQLVLADRGRHIYYTGAAAAITVPANAGTSFPIGSVVTIVNDGSGVITLTRGAGVTMKLAGNGADANRSLGIGAVATLLKVDTNTWFVSGSGII